MNDQRYELMGLSGEKGRRGKN